MENKTRILVVDDEEDILELVRYNLFSEGYEVICAASGEEALELVRQDAVTMILLDLMLPGISGLEVTKILKSDKKTRNIPIIVITAKGDETDIVVGLEMGADDYITKPFSTKILSARVKAVLRRKLEKTVGNDSLLQIGDIVINIGRRDIVVAGKQVELTFSEFEILHFLVKRPGWVFTRTQIVDAIRGDNYAVTDRSVDVQIVGLRKKLGSCGKYIETVRGVGYRFKEVT